VFDGHSSAAATSARGAGRHTARSMPPKTMKGISLNAGTATAMPISP